MVVKVFFIAGFQEYDRPFLRAFLESIFTGQDIPVDYINHAYHKASDAAYHDLEAVSIAVWITEEASFPWQYEY